MVKLNGWVYYHDRKSELDGNFYIKLRLWFNILIILCRHKLFPYGVLEWLIKHN